MNKLPAKQIYLLLVIIVGIIALSIYSTYAIFTFESETSEVVDIKLPTNLQLKTDMTEYKQIEIPANSVNTTDVDIYNTFEYNLCYSIWYKVVGKNDKLFEIYQYNSETLSTGGILETGGNLRTTLLLINDNDKSIKVNFGIATTQETETCKLNLSKDKKLVKNVYKGDVNYLNKEIINNNGKTKKDESNGYLIEKGLNKEITYKDEIIIASKFEIKEEKFILKEALTIPLNEFETKLPEINYETDKYYICNDDCSILYKINKASLNNENIENIENITYTVEEYDKYEIYLKGTSGIKKVGNDYYYYGDNPNNYVYYNCSENKCELWRIVGAFYNEKTYKYDIKIVRNDSIGKYQYNDNEETNDWEYSKIYKYLNKDYKINNFEKLSSNHEYDYEELTTTSINLLEIPKTKINNTNKEISLLTLSDYLNSSTCKNEIIDSFDDCLNNNWLNRTEISNEWFLTLYKELIIEQEEILNEEIPENEEMKNPEEEDNIEIEIVEGQEETDSTIKTEESNDTVENVDEESTTLEEQEEITIKEIRNKVYGSKIMPNLVTEKLSVRPTIYLKDRVLLYSGKGTIEEPYIIK